MELRLDPTLNEWIVVSGSRKDRPSISKGACPFCEGSGEIPTRPWKVLWLPNKFPALLSQPSAPSIKQDQLYRSKPSKGECEVILYTPRHYGSLGGLPVGHIREVIRLWCQRYAELGKRKYVRYVLIFENKGREIGVTLDHPHGQIYAFPFIPPRIKSELSSSLRHWRRKRACLFCQIVKKERSDRTRIVCENAAFVCFLPFFAHWPYGVHIYPKRHVRSLIELTEKEQRMFAMILKQVLTKFDNLFKMSFPYMMVLHQSPTDGNQYPYYHFHVEFYSPYREKGKIKYFASVETGAGTTTFDYDPETKAKELRESRGFS